MSVTALRFANVIGPISWHKKAVTAFFKAIMNGNDICIFGDGRATRDFLYVKDLCAGIKAAVNAAKPGFNAYHLASGREVSVKELAEVARTASSAPTTHRVRTQKEGEVERNFANYDKARAELGFRPTVSLEEAMRLTWTGFQTQKADWGTNRSQTLSMHAVHRRPYCILKIDQPPPCRLMFTRLIGAGCDHIGLHKPARLYLQNHPVRQPAMAGGM